MGKSEHNLGTNDCWATPPEIYEPIIEHMGPIGLDPFGHPEQSLPATTTVLLDKYLSFEIPGQRVVKRTEEDWQDYCWDNHGLVFCNGPFSVLEKVCWKAGAQGDEVINLCPIRSGNKYWQRLVWAVIDGVIFLPRIKFIGADTNAPMHFCLTYRGDRVEQFAKLAAPMGGQFFLLEDG